ncbi:hypothetical protein ONZ45_g14644 [Pleurotus djamor]|nr:hypothetical protein ONZ45_g14644 [Pleurotus djamor]
MSNAQIQPVRLMFRRREGTHRSHLHLPLPQTPEIIISQNNPANNPPNPNPSLSIHSLTPHQINNTITINSTLPPRLATLTIPSTSPTTSMLGDITPTRTHTSKSDIGLIEQTETPV